LLFVLITDKKNAFIRSSSPEFDEVANNIYGIDDEKDDVESDTNEDTEDVDDVVKHDTRYTESRINFIDEVKSSLSHSSDDGLIRNSDSHVGLEHEIVSIVLSENEYEENRISGVSELEAVGSSSEIVPDSEDDANSSISVEIPIVTNIRGCSNVPHVIELIHGMGKLASLYDTVIGENSNSSCHTFSNSQVGSSTSTGTVRSLSRVNAPVIGDSEVLFDDCDQDDFSPPSFDLSFINSPVCRKIEHVNKQAGDFPYYGIESDSPVHRTVVDETPAATTATNSSVVVELNVLSPSCSAPTGGQATTRKISESSVSCDLTPRSRLSRKRLRVLNRDNCSELTKRICRPASSCVNIVPLNNDDSDVDQSTFDAGRDNSTDVVLLSDQHNVKGIVVESLDPNMSFSQGKFGNFLACYVFI